MVAILNIFLQLAVNVRPHELPSVDTNTSEFIAQIFSQLEAAPNPSLRAELMEAAQKDLSRLATIDSEVRNKLLCYQHVQHVPL